MQKIENKFDRQIRENIIEALEEAVSIPREYWESNRSRRREEVVVRQIFIYFMRLYTNQTLQNIADICNLKCHSSVIRNYDIVDMWIKQPENFPLQNLIIKEFKNNYAKRINKHTETLIG